MIKFSTASIQKRLPVFIVVASSLLLIAVLTLFLVNLFSDDVQQVDDPLKRELVIEITKDGFVPADATVRPGTQVTWVNKDTEPHRVAANPFPDHTSLPELDSTDPIGPEATYSFTFDKAGTYTYHDHYKPTINGQISVEE